MESVQKGTVLLSRIGPQTRRNTAILFLRMALSSGIYLEINSDLRPHRRPMKTIRRFFADETGATAIEYGPIAAGISLVIIAAVNGLGSKLNTKFTSINSSLK
jgi:pilus assembly protein Flp/PilA